MRIIQQSATCCAKFICKSEKKSTEVNRGGFLYASPYKPWKYNIKFQDMLSERKQRKMIAFFTLYYIITVHNLRG